MIHESCLHHLTGNNLVRRTGFKQAALEKQERQTRRPKNQLKDLERRQQGETDLQTDKRQTGKKIKIYREIKR